jgi:hypothetical protein
MMPTKPRVKVDLVGAAVPVVVVAANGMPASDSGEAVISSDVGDLMMPTKPRAKVDPVGAVEGDPVAGLAIVSSTAPSSFAKS